MRHKKQKALTKKHASQDQSSRFHKTMRENFHSYLMHCKKYMKYICTVTILRFKSLSRGIDQKLGHRNNRDKIKN